MVKKGRELVELGAKENPNRKIPMPREALLDSPEETQEAREAQEP